MAVRLWRARSWPGLISLRASCSRVAACCGPGRNQGSGSGGSGCICQLGDAVVGVVGLAGAEHGQDDVAAAPGQADQGSVVAFALARLRS
jgi:hypothetical protein